MSEASAFMNGLPQSDWPCGYIFGVSNRPLHPTLRYERLEVCLRSSNLRATLVVKVSDISALMPKGYRLHVYANDECTIPVIDAEITYLDEFAGSAMVVTHFVAHTCRRIKDHLINLLHAMIVHFVIGSPLENKEGKRMEKWYVGLKKRHIRELEYFSKELAGELTEELNETLI